MNGIYTVFKDRKQELMIFATGNIYRETGTASREVEDKTMFDAETKEDPLANMKLKDRALVSNTDKLQHAITVRKSHSDDIFYYLNYIYYTFKANLTFLDQGPRFKLR